MDLKQRTHNKELKGKIMVKLCLQVTNLMHGTLVRIRKLIIHQTTVFLRKKEEGRLRAV